MIQKMPSDFIADIQNMLMPGSSESAVQSPGQVLRASSRRRTSLYSRQVKCCRPRADELEMRERESSKAPPDMETGRSMRTCLSRGVPANHEARSQVKVREKSSTAGKKAFTGGLKRSRDRIQTRGDARVQCKSEASRTRRAIAADRSANDIAKQVTMTRVTDIQTRGSITS